MTNCTLAGVEIYVTSSLFIFKRSFSMKNRAKLVYDYFLKFYIGFSNNYVIGFFRVFSQSFSGKQFNIKLEI